MKRCLCAVMLVVLLLCACSNQTQNTGSGDVQPVAASPSPVPATQITEPTPESTPDDRPALWISDVLEDGYTVIADNGDPILDETACVYVYTWQPIYDLLLSELYESTQEESMTPLEMEGTLYVPELNENQAIQVYRPYPFDDGPDEKYFKRIAYTRADGSYEAMMLLGDEEKKDISIAAMEPNLRHETYEFAFSGTYILDEVKAKLSDGRFDAYIPQGFSMSGGSFGDVNGDGIEDAVLYFVSDGVQTESYSGVMPMFVLIGQPDGGYAVESKNSRALYTSYRSAFYPVAGDGFIDIVYDMTGGAACHHLGVYRFWYDTTQSDWLLKEYSYQPAYTADYEQDIPPSFVTALPQMVDCSVAEFVGGTFYTTSVDWEYFDEVVEMGSFAWGGTAMEYTLGVKINEETQSYEGYIYLRYSSIESGGFIQTVQGAMTTGQKLDVAADTAKKSFTINGDTWVLADHDEDAFHLVK